MPIYDYHCDHCGHAFSAVQRFADDAISVCPSCGKPPRRLLSNPALVFKGSGWYKTDSRGPEKKESTKAAPATDTVATKEESQSKATTAPAAAPAASVPTSTTGDAAPAAKKTEQAERASS
ncbi:MAG: zinc ribbon domain-containing protein [Candidatus Limnocylindrales bacterium]